MVKDEPSIEEMLEAIDELYSKENPLSFAWEMLPHIRKVICKYAAMVKIRVLKGEQNGNTEGNTEG